MNYHTKYPTIFGPSKSKLNILSVMNVALTTHVYLTLLFYSRLYCLRTLFLRVPWFQVYISSSFYSSEIYSPRILKMQRWQMSYGSSFRCDEQQACCGRYEGWHSKARCPRPLSWRVINGAFLWFPYLGRSNTFLPLWSRFGGISLKADFTPYVINSLPSDF